MLLKRRYAQKLQQWVRSFIAVGWLNMLVIALLLSPNLANKNNSLYSLDDYRLQYHDTISRITENDTIARYQQIVDSADKRHEQNKKLREGEVVMWSSSPFISIWYVQYYKKPSRASYPALVDSATQNFIVLGPYTLDGGSYFTQNKQYGTLKYIVTEDNTPIKPFDQLPKGHYAQVPVPIRYSAGSLLIPLPGNNIKVISVVDDICVALIVIAGIIIFFALPLATLKSISKGRAFERANIRDLNIIGWALIAIPVLQLLKQWVLAFIFRSYLFPPLHFNYAKFIDEYHICALCGIIVLIIAKAFNKGYILQQEQDLTV